MNILDSQNLTKIREFDCPETPTDAILSRAEHKNFEEELQQLMHFLTEKKIEEINTDHTKYSFNLETSK